MHTIMISDSKNPDEPVMLLDAMGMKVNILMSDSLKKAAEKTKPDIQYLDSTKMIAGYACKIAKVTVKIPRPGGMDTTFATTVYYTEEIPYFDLNGSFKGLKGFPMEFSIYQMGMNVNIAASSVIKQPVSDSLFNIPSDYQKMSMQDFQQMMMSKMGGGGGAQK